MDGRRRWWDGVWCWNWYWQTVAVLCLSIQGRRTYRATGKGTFFVGPSPNRGGGGCPTYVGATLSKDGHLHPGRDGEPAILATVDSAVEFREGPNILSVRPGVGMPARLTLADSQWSCGPPAHSNLCWTQEWHARSPARTKPAARRLHHLRLVGSRWPAGAAHGYIVAVLQGDAVGSVGSQRAL